MKELIYFPWQNEKFLQLEIPVPVPPPNLPQNEPRSVNCDISEDEYSSKVIILDI